MTMKEAKTVAQQFRPVVYNGNVYQRISEVGIHYDRNGKRFDFLTLVDKNSTVRVRPDKVTEASPEEIKEAMKK